MALKKCGECGKEVSSKAPNCPGCGAPIAPKKIPGHFGCGSSLLVIGIAIFIISIVVGEIMKMPTTTPTPARTSPSTTPRPTPNPIATPAHTKEIATFRDVVTVADCDEVISDLASEPNGPPWRLTITVNEKWDALPTETQLEYAKTFRGAWAGIWNRVAPEPGGAQISITIKSKIGETVGEYSWPEKREQETQLATGPTARRAPATVQNAKLVDFVSPANGRTMQMVIVTLKNTGSTPIRVVDAEITSRDSSGKVVETHNYTIFAKSDSSPGIAPGSTWTTRKGEGFILPGNGVEKSKSVKVKITTVMEHSGF